MKTFPITGICNNSKYVTSNSRWLGIPHHNEMKCRFISMHTHLYSKKGELEKLGIATVLTGASCSPSNPAAHMSLLGLWTTAQTRKMLMGEAAEVFGATSEGALCFQELSHTLTGASCFLKHLAHLLHNKQQFNLQAVTPTGSCPQAQVVLQALKKS